jgi:protein SCO1/2
MRDYPTGSGGIALALLVAVAVAACGRTAEQRDADRRARESGYRGVALAEPVQRPDFTLTDTEGRPFRFVDETKGFVTLLFFGYTHCPDICPVQMANIASVLSDLPSPVQRAIKTVFVTTDPERDTPDRMRQWLAGFDRGFIGLRGDLEQVNEIQRQLRLAPAVRMGETTDYAVGHASQVLAFGADGPARLVYPSGTRQADWAHDLPRLVDEARATSGR